jgi:hypothetical protein
MANLISLLKQTVGPRIGRGSEDGLFCETQTDMAANIAHNFLTNLKFKWEQHSSIAPIKKLEELNEFLPMFNVLQGKGIEFRFAPKDLSFFKLGDKAGDCSAFVRKNQIDLDMENVFYDVPMWTAMPNYQVLTGHYNGKFVIKFHLIVVSIKSLWTLLIDATETTPLVRDDVELIDPNLIEKREEVFDKGIELIKTIGRKMGNVPVLAEFFSNTEWIRDKYEAFPRKAVHIPTELQDGLIYDAVHDLLKINSIKTEALNYDVEIPLHIQAQRDDISDQGAKPGYRILYIIDGAEPDTYLPYRGI